MVDVVSLDAVLPQTQCGECGHPGCMPYAEALLTGASEIDQCPPGGETVVIALAQLLKKNPTPFIPKARAQYRPPSVMTVREPECIGCTKCIQACPVDAIIGTSKHMHAILADACTGCGLCVPACPVDCIDTIPIEKATYDKDRARQRFEARKLRQLKALDTQQKTYREKSHTDTRDDDALKKAYIQNLLARKG